ncbi:hypothetical protein AB0H28_27240 [Micromonospora sp. NPDC050980]|uniref:hypothetical protein n=1 Tax=Micromonospora sp. NPDC050980 TaxID=3155161 RepID=UPI0033C241EE
MEGSASRIVSSTQVPDRCRDEGGDARMKPCPRCGATGSIAIEPILASRPAGTYSIAGVQTKIAAEQKWALTCAACHLRIVGHLENASYDEDQLSFTDGHFVADGPPDLT